MAETTRSYLSSSRVGSAKASSSARSAGEGKTTALAVPQYDDDDQPANFIQQITSEVLDKYMDKKWRTQTHRHITFRSEVFDLASLDGLLKQPIDLTGLESLDVSNNSLKELKCLAGKSTELLKAGKIQGNIRFQSLRVLKARKNEIGEFSVVLPTLRELDLSYNRLREIPPTAGITNLEVLLLSHNDIDGSWVNLRVLIKLKKLDLADNRFNFKPTQFGEEVDHISALPNLLSLRMKDNLFAKTTNTGGCFPEYQTLLIKRMRHLHELDDLDKGNFTQALKLADAMPDQDLEQYDIMVYNRQKIVSHAAQTTLHDTSTSTQVPTWTELTSSLEEGLMDAAMVPKTIKQVARICREIAEADPKQVDEIWRDSTTKQGSGATVEISNWAEVDSKIRGFLDNYMILLGRVEETKASRMMLIRSLARLSTVHTPVFHAHSGEKREHASLGVKCIETFGFLMKRNESMEEEIMSVLQEIVIEPLSTTSKQSSVPINTVQALCHLETNKLPKALSPIVKWLARMYCEGNGHPQPDLAHLLAVATSAKDNAREALDLETLGKDNSLPGHVKMALENKKLTQAEDCREQYISHLIIIQNLSSVNQKVIEIFQERHLHRDLVSHFKLFFGDDIDVVDSTRTKGHNLLNKPQLNLRTCGRILYALTAMMATREVMVDLLDAKNPWGRLLQYLAIAPKASPVADPMMLAASLSCMWVILRRFPREEEGKRQAILNQIVKDLDKMKPMLEIIDANSSKYRELCAAAERHVVERENMKQVVSTQVPRFGNLHNPLVHSCFQAVVELVEYFSAEAKRDKICAEVNVVMNASERETLLFKLLEVPCDDLQDAVMRCFEQVDMADMTAEEVEYLIKLLDNVKDVGTEADVLENIIRQLRAFAGVRNTETAINKENAETAVKSVMTVLLKNAKRETFGRASEEVSKHKLSQACIAFLQTASTLHELRNSMREKHIKQVMIEVLKCEDDLCSYTAPDQAIECTWTGGDIETLLATMSGTTRLRPRGKVAFRVLNRIADILEGNREQTNELLNQSRNFADICKREAAVWDEEKMRGDLRFLNDLERDDRTMQQRTFSQYSGLDRIVAFFDGLFADEATRAKAIMEETKSVSEGQQFMEVGKATANAAWEEARKAETEGKGLEALVSTNLFQLNDAADANSSSSSDAGRYNVEAPVLEYEGRSFQGTDADDEVDLGLPPYSFDGELGGAMSIFICARWDSLNFKSRLLDFGSGCPRDNIVIGNQAATNNMVFEFFVDTNDIPNRLVVHNAITVGHMNKYLLTVTTAGQMKVYRDGTVIGERHVGIAPRPVVRNNLYIGRSAWSSSAPFHGVVADLKIWTGKALEWDDVVKEEPVDEDDEGENDETEQQGTGAEQQQFDHCMFLLKVFLDVHDKDNIPPPKQELQGGLYSPSMTKGMAISEQPISDETQGHINIAYPLAAVFRACYALMKVPATEKVRKDQVKSLNQNLLIARLMTLVSMCGPFNCRIATKFLRLMSSAMEMPPNEATRKEDHLVGGILLSNTYANLCHSAVMAVRQVGDQDLRKRGAELCTEIVRIASTVCRAGPFCVVSEVKQVQGWFVELYLERLMSITVIKNILQMLIANSQGEEMGEAIWELSRQLLSQLLQTSKRLKHPILKVFSENAISTSGALRPSFLAALLAESRKAFEKGEIEKFLNSQDRRESADVDSGEPERIMAWAKTEVLVSGKQLALSNPRAEVACFMCTVTSQGLYIIDATAVGFPESPKILQSHSHMGITRLVKGEADQVLYVGYVKEGRSEYDLSEEFITLICFSDSDRNDLFAKLHALSEPPGGQFRHRATTQNDYLFRAALEIKVPEAVMQTTFVVKEGRLEMIILGETTLWRCGVQFDRWLPPVEDEDDEHHSSQESADEGQAKKHEKKQVSAADKIHLRRSRARMRFESTAASGFEKAQSSLISVRGRPRLASLQEISYYSDQEPRMTLQFLGGEPHDELVDLVFLEDTIRERWRKALLEQLRRVDESNVSWQVSTPRGRGAPLVWKRHILDSPSGTSTPLPRLRAY